MNRCPDGSPRRTAVLRSPALHLGSIEVSEATDRHTRHPLSGTRLKGRVFPALYWLIRHMPAGLALLPARLTVTLVRCAYRWPGNRLRKACEALARIAQHEQALSHDPHHIYARFLDNALGVIENFFALYRRGHAAVLPRTVMDPQDIETIDRLIGEHGGVILAVPHNIGSAFSALRIGHAFDMLLVAKNPPTIARTRIALDFYERMQVCVLMVRGGNTFELSRVLFSVLREEKLLAATLDNIDRSNNSIGVQMFGQTVGLPGWAARVAVKMQVPIVPAWFQSTGRQLRIITGNAILADSARTVVSHYARFFEQRILEDPASWAYLADKHWQQILENAAGRHPVAPPDPAT
jgi:lauroyl/myristoyl acyltransferase